MEPDKVMDFLLKMKPLVIKTNELLVRPRFVDNKYEIQFATGERDPRAYVTQADQYLDFVLTYASELLGIPSYGEESLQKRAEVIKFKTHSTVDGVDGTGGLVQGLYESCGTLLALLQEDEPVGAIAYAPETGALSIATKWHDPIYELNGVPQKQAEPVDYILSVHRTEAWNPKLDWFLEWLGKKRGIHVEVVEGGGPGSFGAAHFRYPYTVFSGTVGNGNWKEWDVAAPQLILETAKPLRWYTSDTRGQKHTFGNPRPNYDYGFLATRLDHVGLPHEDFVRYLGEFIETHRERLVLPDARDDKDAAIKLDDESTAGTILVTDKIYTAFQHSPRLREWKEKMWTVPPEERGKLLRRKTLGPKLYTDPDSW